MDIVYECYLVIFSSRVYDLENIFWFWKFNNIILKFVKIGAGGFSNGKVRRINMDN